MKAIQSIELPTGKDVSIGLTEPSDLPLLHLYLLALSEITRQRFAPHDHAIDTLQSIHRPGSAYLGFIAKEEGRDNIISYAVIKSGLLEHDLLRLQQYKVIKGSWMNFNSRKWNRN